MTDEKKCTHPHLRSFKFADGKTIESCPAQIPFIIDGRTLWTEPCPKGDLERRRVLCKEKRSK